MPLFLGHLRCDDKRCFPGAKAMLTCCVLIVCSLKKKKKKKRRRRRNVTLTCIKFFVLTRCKTALKTMLLWGSFSGVIWERSFQATP